MGLSSSQARLLSLTGRMHDIEYMAQKLEAQKLQMANDSKHVYKEYEDALNATKVQLRTIGTDGSDKYIDATYNNMIQNGYRIEFSNKVKVVQTTANNFETAKGNKDYFIYLETGKSGTPQGYTPIYTAEQLKNISLNGKYMLMADIDLKDENWAPIGTSGNPFIGTFDGNGHTISNLTINTNTKNAGFFGVTKNATISNVVISDAKITGNASTVGTLIGHAINSNIYNCSINNTNINGKELVGGLVGRGNLSTITNCNVSGNVTSTTYNSGGFIGVCAGNSIENCTTSANVTATSTQNTAYGTSANFIGGFAGYVGYDSSTSTSSTISNCSASGNVEGIREVGGFVGVNYNTITNCIATGNVIGRFPEPVDETLPDSYNIGGFAGGNSGTINNCGATGSVTGFANVGGFVGRTSAGAIDSSYATGDVTAISGIDSATGNKFSSSAIGGFIGHNAGANISNSHYDSNTTAQNKAAGNTSSGTSNITNTPSENIATLSGPTTVVSVTAPTIIYKNEEQEAINTGNLFENMTSNGYIIEANAAPNTAEGHEDDSAWFTNMLNSGFLYIFKKDINGNFYQTNLATDTNLQEIPNEIDIKKAEAKYEASMRKINAKDKKFDTDLAALESERNAIKTEMETLKNVAKDNVDRTFKLFS